MIPLNCLALPSKVFDMSPTCLSCLSSHHFLGAVI